MKGDQISRHSHMKPIIANEEESKRIRDSLIETLEEENSVLSEVKTRLKEELNKKVKLCEKLNDEIRILREGNQRWLQDLKVKGDALAEKDVVIASLEKANVELSEAVKKKDAIIMERKTVDTSTSLTAEKDGKNGSSTCISVKTNELVGVASEIKKVNHKRKTCHHCGKVGHIRPQCFKWLAELKQRNTCCVSAPVATALVSTKKQSWKKEEKLCHHCGKAGHIRPHCYKWQKEQKWKSVQPVKAQVPVRAPASQRTVQRVMWHTPRRVVCHYCGQAGHIRPRCFALLHDLRIMREEAAQVSAQVNARPNKAWVKKIHPQVSIKDQRKVDALVKHDIAADHDDVIPKKSRGKELCRCSTSDSSC